MRTWILSLCLVLATAPAFADGNAKAKQLYDEGFRHFNVAEYPQAIESWKQAYLLSQKPLLLFNIGQAYRLSGDCKQAMTFYDNYQNAETAIKNQEELDQAIAACKAADAKPADAKPADAKPVDAKPADAKPTPAITTTTPPPVADTPASSPPPPVRPEPPPQPPPPSEPAQTSNSRRTIGLITGIAGVVFEGAAVVFAIQGQGKASDAEKVTMWDQHARDLESAGQRDNKLAWGFGIAGGAAIVAGVVLYVTGGESAEHGVAIIPIRGGAQLGWAHSF